MKLQEYQGTPCLAREARRICATMFIQVRSESQQSSTIVIEAGKTRRRYLADLWRYRELMLFLAWRDVLVRYKQTAAGILWAVIRPAVSMLVFYFVFGRLARLPSNGVPYPLMVISAVLPWQMFASALSDSSMSLVNNSNLVSKVYFPRLVVPIAGVFVSLLDFVVAAVLFAVVLAFSGVTPGPQIFALPIFIVLALLSALGVGLWFCSLNVHYRDIRHLVPFILQIGMYASPVGYAASLVPEKWRWLYDLNPMAVVIEGFRWAILGDAFAVKASNVAIAFAIAALFLVTGLRHFRATERSFADVI